MLSLLLFVPLVLASSTIDSITLPLNRPSSTGKHTHPNKHIAKRGIPLKDASDAVYYGNGTVGNQTFQFLFDTGSSDVFVPDPQCAFFQCSGERYDHSGHDLNKTVELSYGSGSVAGYLFEDSVSIDGLTAKNQLFVSTAVDELLQDSGANGIIGLAFPKASKTNGTTFFENLMDQGKIKKPEFGIYYGRLSDGTGDDSEITLGGCNPKKYHGPVHEVPVADKYWWTVELDEVKVGGQCAGNSTRGYAAIDSGTQNIVAPRAAVAEIFSKIPGGHLYGNTSVGGFLDSTTSYTYPCNTSAEYLPKLVFGGKEFAIDAKDFSFADNLETPGYCLANIFGRDIEGTLGKTWIVGDVFLRSWYTIYNWHSEKFGGKPSVSFAKAV